jgi:hypothetical protein
MNKNNFFFLKKNKMQKKNSLNKMEWRKKYKFKNNLLKNKL